MNPLQTILIAAVRGYQRVLSPVLTTLFGPLGFGCRFHPTCSAYAAEALRAHGCLKGGWLALRRLGRCHPWGPDGDDPVPPPSHPAPHSPRLESCRRDCNVHKV